jgi:hypothetical protein
MPVSETACGEVAIAVAKWKRRQVREASGRHYDDVPSYVYVFTRDGLGSRTKVGVSSDVKSRLLTLTRTSGLPLQSFFTFECPSRDLAFMVEKRFQKLAEATHIGSEFYNLDPIEAVRMICIGYRGLIDDLCLSTTAREEIIYHSGIADAECQYESKHGSKIVP